MSKQIEGFYQFGSFKLIPAERLLLRDGQGVVSLTPKVFDLLRVLVEHSGHLLTKEELLQTVWGESHVEEGNLTFCISMLRKSLGESKTEPQYIETVPRRGYRFIAAVKHVNEASDDVVAEPPASVEKKFPIVEAPTPEPVLTISAEASASGRTLRRRLVAVTLTTLVVVCGVIIYDLKRLAGQNSPAGPAKMAVAKRTHTGKSAVAAISPDGKHIARVTEEGNQQSLWVEQVATSHAVQIVPPAAVKYIGLTFSVDGHYLYYVGWQVWDNNLPSALYKIPALGGTPQKLIAEVHSAVTTSPDGQSLAFVRNNKRLGETAVVIARADGTAERTLSVRRRPDNYKWVAWSPDGRTIAGSVQSLDGGLHMSVAAIDVKSGAERLISAERWAACGQLQWLGDGSGLVVAATPEAGQPTQIWHVAYPEGLARRITNDVSSYDGVSLTQDSRTLVTLQADQLTNIWVTPPQGSLNNSAQITFGKSDGLRGLAWTPDGRIVYGSLASGKPDIWVMNADGSNQKQLTGGAGNNAVPSVSPDGRYVVFASDRTGTYHIWRMNIDGTGALPLTEGKFDQAPDCSPDGRWVHYGSWQTGKPTLWKVGMDGGEAQQIVEEYAHSPVVSPDGKLVAYFHADNERDVQLKTVVAALDGKMPSKEFEISSPPVRWHAADRALSYVVNQGGGSNIWSQPIAGGAPQPLTDFKAGQILDFDWSPDGKRLAYTRTAVFRDVIMIRDFK